MDFKRIVLVVALFLAPAVIFGCGGGGAAFGLLGAVADGGIFNTDNDPVAGSSVDNTSLSIAGNIEVAGNGAPPLGGPSRAFAANGDAIELWVSTDATTFAKSLAGVVTNGAYTFTGPFRNRYLKVLRVAGGDAMYLGKVGNNATGTVAIPVAFDTSAVLLTRILEKQGALATLVCGSAAHSNLKTAAEARVKAVINNDLRLALAAVKANDATLSAANLGLDLKTRGLTELLASNSWDLGAATVTPAGGTAKSWKNQVLSLSDVSFVFYLINSSTDQVFLNGSFVAGTSSVAFTISGVSGFPQGSTKFGTMDQAGETFTLGGVAINNKDQLSATFNGQAVTINKYVTP